LSVDPSISNPFALEEKADPQYYSPSRRRTHYTGMVEKRFKLKPVSNPSPVSERLGSIIQKFNSEHPDLAKKLDDPEKSLTPSSVSSHYSNSHSEDASLFDSEDISKTPSSRSASSIGSETDEFSGRNVPQKKVKWTPSTRDHSPDISSSTPTGDISEERTPPLLVDTPSPLPEQQPAILDEFDDFADMGLGRRQRKYSIIK